MGGRVVLVILPTATSSGGKTLVGLSATLTPGTDARGLKPIGAFGSDPFAKPTNTKTNLLGLSKEQGCLPHWRDGGKADTGACGGHHGQPEEPACARSQSSGRLDGSRLGKPTSRCVQHAAIVLYLCSKGLTCVVQHNGFTFASHFPSPGLAFLKCYTGRQVGSPLNSLDGPVGWGGRETPLLTLGTCPDSAQPRRRLSALDPSALTGLGSSRTRGGARRPLRAHFSQRIHQPTHRCLLYSLGDL